MLAVRALTALAATAAMLGALVVSNIERPEPVPGAAEWTSRVTPPLAETRFGEAFAELARVESFQFEVEQQGKVSEFWGADDGRLRFEHGDDRYSIVHRDRQWKVDEPANRAAPSAADYFYLRDQAPALDPWKVLQLEPLSMGRTSYREVLRDQDGEQFVASYFDAQFAGEAVAVEAQLDPARKLPLEMLIWPKQPRGTAPLARFHLVQAGQGANDAKFKIAETLTDDGRIGKIVDTQGIVTLRARASSRWTPICEPNTLLQPGDWLRTDNQGANAVTVQLAPSTKLILGPGTLVEMMKPDRLQVNSGVVQVTASDKNPIQLTGPDGQVVTVHGEQLWQVSQNKLAAVKHEPVWLKGYRGQIPQETLGSLVALVNGRNVPLSVGYHKVTVDIRDQIARTTIEESFVNHTDAVLEGQFYFPLPQDASISGFGMWIGNELVEADIVEKQRAREIFETILREKRDPGLLEWTGGNIFKARVYPIPAHGEKRIKITYSQVLPLVGDTFRYHYALRSDLLKQNPLRQLEVAVTIHSTQPIQQVASPSHPTRTQRTPHSARVEFSARNYAPTRDFEVATTLATRSHDLTFVPHQRGDDGFFMLLVQPPNQSGGWSRELVGDGGPLELLILADTSASMDQAARTRQAEVIGALLSALSPLDTFNLATCDADCQWTFDKSSTAEPKFIEQARSKLQEQRSMGWTNLQKAWESALQRANPGTHVIYVGDGVITRGTGDPAADLQAISRAAAGKAVLGHAIAVSSSFESPVLKAIAAVGGGSVRSAAGEVKPAQVAHGLLVEATRPSLRNMQIEFSGLRTARVYPPTLPNLPAGSQQVVLGRYLPGTENTTGEVIVRGILDGKSVAYRTEARTPVAPPAGSEDDASFIPRLWARLHLDELLTQGSSQQIQDEIIALSEEYHLITPYTSLLVLESDADRERFKVKKRFQMRDGERFFQKGRNEANYALVQQQMMLAKAWRRQLRQRLIEQLHDLGRDPSLLQIPSDGGAPSADFDPLIEMITKTIEPQSWSEFGLSSNGPQHWLMMREERFGFQAVDSLSRSGRESLLSLGVAPITLDFAGTAMAPEFLSDSDIDEKALWRSADLGRSHSDRFYDGLSDDYLQVHSPLSNLGTFGRDYYLHSPSLRGRAALSDRGTNWGEHSAPSKSKVQSLGGVGGALSYGFSLRQLGAEFSGRARGSQLPILLVQAPRRVAITRAKPVVSRWPAEAIAIVNRLRMEDDLRRLEGLSISRTTESFQPQRGQLLSRTTTRELVSPHAWLVRGDEQSEADPLLDWADKQVRGRQSLAFDTAVTRPADPQDLEHLPNLLGDGSSARWHEAFSDYDVVIEKPAENRLLLIAKAPSDFNVGGYDEHRWLIDGERQVVLEVDRRFRGERVDRTTFSEFKQVGSRWLATLAEHFAADGKRTLKSTLQLRELSPEQFQAEWEQEFKVRKRAVTIELPLPKLSDAQQRAVAGKATVTDRFVLLASRYARQQWAEAEAQLDAAEKAFPGQAAWTWMRLTLWQQSRRHEELKQRLTRSAAHLAGHRHPAEYAIALRLRSLSQMIAGGNEQLALLDELKPTYERFTPPLAGARLWSHEQMNAFSQAGREDDYRRALAAMANTYDDDLYYHYQYSTSLRQAGDSKAALDWLEKQIARQDFWSTSESDRLRGYYADILDSAGRYSEAAKFAAEWADLQSESTEPYARLLGYLILSGEDARAFELAQSWIAAAEANGKQPLKGALHAKTVAAVQLLLGDGRGVGQINLDLKHVPQLERLLLAFVGREDTHDLAMQIWNQTDFHNSDARHRVHAALFNRAATAAGELPVAELRRLFEIALSYVNNEQHRAATQMATALKARWAAEKQPHRRKLLRELLMRLFEHASVAGKEEFLRTWVKSAPPEERIEATRQLYDYLVIQPWSPERATETLALIERLSAADDPAARLLEHVRYLQDWTNRMEESERTYLSNKIERRDKLTRDALAKLEAAAVKQAREDISQRLKVSGSARKPDDEFGRWLKSEHQALEIRLERNLGQVQTQLLGDLRSQLASKQRPEALKSEIDVASRTLEFAFEQRILSSLLHLAAHPTAKPAFQDELERLFSTEWKKQRDRSDRETHDDIDWQLLQYDLLVIRDRPRQLERLLRDYITLGDEAGHWRKLLGYLLAETNHLEAATQQFEELERAERLESEDYRALAGWYQALDRRQQFDSAQVKIYGELEPWRLEQAIRGHLQRWRNPSGPLPEELDPHVLLMFQALLRGTDSPHQYLSRLREFYQVTHDPRLLLSLAKALPGHTAERVYPMLGASWQLLQSVEHEATIDELLTGIVEVRKQAVTPLDQRALDLLTVLAERRAAELPNGAEPHARAAVAALERAEKPAWNPGEPRHMAEFLAGLGAIPVPALRAGQLRLLEQMLSKVERGSDDALLIGSALAVTEWNNQHQARALDLLSSAIEQYRQAQGGEINSTALAQVNQLTEWQMTLGQFLAAEEMLVARRAQVTTKGHRDQLTLRIWSLYARAIRERALTSLGRGEPLYRGSLREANVLLARNEDLGFQAAVLERMVDIYRSAKLVSLPSAKDDLLRFAREEFPRLAERQVGGYEGTVNNMANAVQELAGYQEALRFLLDRIDSEPTWARYHGHDAWSRWGGTMAHWKREVVDIGDLEPRLLAFVVKELKRDLTLRSSRSRYMYHEQYSEFWKARQDAFAAAAEEVLAKSPDSGIAAMYIGDYLFRGLGRRERAIEIMLAAHQRQLLDDSQQQQLVAFLHEANRHIESIPILEQLVERFEFNVTLRCKLMIAYHHAKRPRAVIELLQKTDTILHKNGYWTQRAAAELGQTCFDCQLFEQAVEYLKEAAAERTRMVAGTGSDAELASLYQTLARSHAGLKNTARAVDAACSAVVVWPQSSRERTLALNTLLDVLRASPNLSNYAQQLEEESKKTGQDRPVVRKSLGQVFQEKGDMSAAIVQYRAAVALSPDDSELHAKLIECLDVTGDRQGAIAQSFAWLNLNRRNLELWQKLAQRFDSLEQPAEAERARTSLAEVMPGETEGLVLLAQSREQQERWPEALEQWQLVGKLRKLEPTGLLNIARVQLKLGQKEAAAAAIKQLDATAWPSHFSAELQKQLPELKQLLAN